MALDDIAGAGTDQPASQRTRWISIWIGVLAVMLAICTMGGDNATKDATRANIDASDLWTFFQAKNVRRTSYQLAADELQLMLVANRTLDAAARQQIEAKIAEYRAQVERLTKDGERREGLDELFQRAKEKEVERDAALRKDPLFDWAQALLQIAIVLASVSIVANSRELLWGSGGLGALGTALMVAGFVI